MIDAASVRRYRAAVVAALAVVGVLAPVQARGRVGMPPCVSLGTTPNFATDRILFCGTQIDGPQRGPLDLYRSVDAGRSWDGPFHVVEQASWSAITGIYLSPNYHVDGTLFVGADGVIYLSKDRGETFTTVGGGYRVTYPFASVFVDELPNGRPHAALVTQPQITFTGPCCAYVLDSLTPDIARPLPPNLADWAFADHYLVPPDFAATRQAVMIGRPGMSRGSESPVWSRHPKAYACDAEFACARVLYEFTAAEEAESWVRFTGSTYTGSPDTYVLTYASTTRPSLRLFRSPDHGRTWTRWESANQLLARLRWDTQVTVAASPDTPKRLFLFVGADDSGPASIPQHQVFRSDDNGVTWRRIGHAWGPTQKARSKSTLPWNSSSAGYPLPVVGPGGRLYVPAGRRADAWGKTTTGFTPFVYCSRDYGVKWTRAC